MAATELLVHRLRLAAPGQGVAARVEDALRVSNKPAALLHRHVLVRRLHLRAAPGASAQSLALLFERAWRRLAGEARPIGSATEADDAVWVPGEAEAVAALVARWARGGSADAWFWRRIAAPAVDGPWPMRAAALMLAPARDTDDREWPMRATTRAVPVRLGLAAIVEASAERAFVEGLDDRTAAALLERLPVDGRASAAPSRHVLTANVMVQAHAMHFARPRLAAMLLRCRSGESPGQVAQISPLLTARVAPARQRTDPVEFVAAATASHERSHAETQARPVLPSAPALPLPVAAAPQAAESAWAGLWLLLPILLRCGLADADAPLRAWAEALRAACVRFAVPDDDPVRGAIAALDLPDGFATSAWLRTARLAAVRDARLPLLRIARRRGTAWVSAERIDVVFPATADVRIRRAGFDIDPGFLPWLGRTVHFHYA